MEIRRKTARPKYVPKAVPPEAQGEGSQPAKGAKSKGGKGTKTTRKKGEKAKEGTGEGSSQGADPKGKKRASRAKKPFKSPEEVISDTEGELILNSYIFINITYMFFRYSTFNI